MTNKEELLTKITNQKQTKHISDYYINHVITSNAKQEQFNKLINAIALSPNSSKLTQVLLSAIGKSKLLTGVTVDLDISRIKNMLLNGASGADTTNYLYLAQTLAGKTTHDNCYDGLTYSSNIGDYEKMLKFCHYKTTSNMQNPLELSFNDYYEYAEYKNDNCHYVVDVVRAYMMLHKLSPKDSTQINQIIADIRQNTKASYCVYSADYLDVLVNKLPEFITPNSFADSL